MSAPWATAQTRLSEGVINLGVGHPALGTLPLRELERAAAHRFAQGSAEFLQYGAEWGDGALRLALAGLLSREYGVEVPAEELFISGGVSQAIDLACAVLTEPGDTVIVEDPTYFLALGIFRDHRLNVVPAPLDENGLDLEELERLIRRWRPRLLYTVPTHQNPSGVTLSEERRARVAELAQEHRFYVLADEVYHLLTFGDPAPPTFSAWAYTGRVMSLGSFSKILAPGVRLGWIHARPDLLERLAANGAVTSAGGFSPLGSGVVRSMIGLRPLGVGFRRPQGGYFIWAGLPPGVDSAELLGRALDCGVRFQPGHLFSPGGQGHSDRLRLCFAYYEEAELCEGVRRLGQALSP